LRTRGFVSWLAGASFGAPAVVRAQEAGYARVPPAERLTFAGVVADALPQVQLMMALMAAGAVASVVVWAMSLGKVGQGDARGVAGALARLKIVRSGAAPLGFLTAAYVLFSGFLGIANVRPTPTLAVLAPGFAEATLAVMLGLLATAVAVICERHLEGRVRRAAA
jgi:hypothetical protein